MWTSLLVHLDASPRAAVRLALAQALAGSQAGELKALYGVLPALLATPWAVAEGVPTASAAMAELDRLQRQRARATFEQGAAAGALQWVDGGSAPYWALLQHALYADLLVLGQDDPDDADTGTLPPDLVPTLLADSGKPALVVPFAGSFAGPLESLAREVLIAWKPTREAARAVSAALPLLRAATRVHVAHRPEGTVPDGPEPTGALGHWLQLHGVKAPLQVHDLGPGSTADVGEALLSLTADTGAGVLVMGSYGHSRAREWVLGGASRSVLRSMTVPVLMAH